MKNIFLVAAVCALFCACNRSSDGCCPTQTAPKACCPAPKPCCPAPAPKPCCPAPAPKPCCPAPAPKPCCPAPKPCCPTNGTTQMNQDSQNPDWQTTTRVKQAIMSDSSLSNSARFVSVTTNNGVVTLTGTVPTDRDSRIIEKKVKSVQGVRSVDNQLVIGS